MTMSSMRKLIDIMESTMTAYEVMRHESPGSSRIVDKTVIKASDRADLRNKLNAWIEQQGLDPDDEDDMSYISYSVK